MPDLSLRPAIGHQQWGLFTGPVGADKEQLDIEELIAGRVIIGSPDECAEQLSASKREPISPAWSRGFSGLAWIKTSSCAR